MTATTDDTKATDPETKALLLSEIEVAARGVRFDAEALVAALEWAAREAAQVAQGARARLLDQGVTTRPTIGVLAGLVRDAEDRAERHERSVACVETQIKTAQLLGFGAEARAVAERVTRGES